MARVKNPALFDGELYTGSITLNERADHTYIWRVDNKSYLIANLGNVTIAEIPNPYYRLALVNALSEGSVVFVSYVPPEPNAPTYRLWEYVPADQIPFGNKTLAPYSINYGGIDLKIRLHPRVWLKHGMVVQVIYYAEFFPAGTVIDDIDVFNLREENIDSLFGRIVVADGVVLDASNRATYINTTQELNDQTVYTEDTYEVPVVRERWNWVLEPDTNFAVMRNIHIEWYRKDDVNQIPTILPPTKEYVKYYPTATEKIKEIERRRSNVIGELKDNVITFIVMTETLPSIAIDPTEPTPSEFSNAKLNAIALGQAYMTDLVDEIMDFQANGTDNAALKTMDPTIRSVHAWLDNDLASIGLPGVTVAEYIYSELTTDISEVLDAFSWDDVPDF